MRADTGQGTIFDNAVHIRHDDTALMSVLAALIALDDAKDRMGEIMKPEALGKALAESNEGRTAIMMTRTGYGALLSRKRETLESDRRAATREPSERDAEYRAYWRTLSPAEQAQRLATASVDELGAIDRDADLANLGPELRDRLRERFMLANFIDRSALAGSHPAKPTIDNPLATGVDHDALNAAAEAVLTKHRARLEQSKQDEATLRDLIRYLAVTFDMPAEAVLERVLP